MTMTLDAAAADLPEGMAPQRMRRPNAPTDSTHKAENVTRAEKMVRAKEVADAAARVGITTPDTRADVKLAEGFVRVAQAERAEPRTVRLRQHIDGSQQQQLLPDEGSTT